MWVLWNQESSADTSTVSGSCGHKIGKPCVCVCVQLRTRTWLLWNQESSADTSTVSGSCGRKIGKPCVRVCMCTAAHAYVIVVKTEVDCRHQHCFRVLWAQTRYTMCACVYVYRCTRLCECCETRRQVQTPSTVSGSCEHIIYNAQCTMHAHVCVSVCSNSCPCSDGWEQGEVL